MNTINSGVRGERSMGEEEERRGEGGTSEEKETVMSEVDEGKRWQKGRRERE